MWFGRWERFRLAYVAWVFKVRPGFLGARLVALNLNQRTTSGKENTRLRCPGTESRCGCKCHLAKRGKVFTIEDGYLGSSWLHMREKGEDWILLLSQFRR